MQMLTRRCCIAGCGLWLLDIPGAIASGTRHNAIYGCTLTASETSDIHADGIARRYITGKEPIPHSGDKDFDLALALTLAKISDCLNVSPEFAYYDDYDGPNAFASPEHRSPGADGTVLFGQRFLKQLMTGHENPEVAVAGVCAHEFGHILQYKLHLDNQLSDGQPTVKRVELNADYFAGYFAGVRKRQLQTFPAAVVAMTQYNSGDDMLNNPKHHGTPKERGEAIEKGYQTAYVDQKPLLDAIKIGVEFVTSRF
jgi:hypothetical protein